MKSSYLVNRQAPQEIIQPNEEEIEDDGDMKDEDSYGGESDSSDNENPKPLSTRAEGEAQPTGKDEEFSEVKLCSKYGAFLIEKKSGWEIRHAT